MDDRLATIDDSRWFFYFAESLYCRALGLPNPQDNFLARSVIGCVNRPYGPHAIFFEAFFSETPQLSELDEALLHALDLFIQICNSGSLKTPGDENQQLRDSFSSLLAGCCSFVGKCKHDVPFNTQSWGVVFRLPSAPIFSVESFLITRCDPPGRSERLRELIGGCPPDFKERFNASLEHAVRRSDGLHAAAPRVQPMHTAPAVSKPTLAAYAPQPMNCCSGKDQGTKRARESGNETLAPQRRRSARLKYIHPA